MHLIHTKDLRREDFTGRERPRYGILSHRWRDGEVTFGDISTQSPTSVQKHGASKILACCEEALRDGLSYVWIDTCCIDKSSSAELSEAINSMYTWYAEAQTCYVYLDDVSSVDDFSLSEWFTRGWTLQELLAPAQLRFFNEDWNFIGTRTQLCDEISVATEIDESALQGPYDALSTTFTVAQRMAWASKRATTRPEDMAYSLMGLFGLNIPILYGEGGVRAFVRLQQEIIKISSDQSIFAWSSKQKGYRSLLATSHEFFQGCHDIIMPRHSHKDAMRPSEYAITNQGLSVELTFQSRPRAFDTYAVFLNCTRKSRPYALIVIYLEFTSFRALRKCARVMQSGEDIQLEVRDEFSSNLKIYVPQYGVTPCPAHTKTQGFHVCYNLLTGLSHEQGRYTISDFDWFQNYRIGKVEMPQRGRGAAGVVKILNFESRLAAIQLGFDSRYKPVCRLIERRVKSPDGIDPKDLEDEWIDERIQYHPGACDIKPKDEENGRASDGNKEPYFVLRERGAWNFGIKQTLIKSSQSFRSPEEDDSELYIYIKELLLEFAIERRVHCNELIWFVSVLEFRDRRNPREFPCGTELVNDPNATDWHSSPNESYRCGKWKDWKALKVLKTSGTVAEAVTNSPAAEPA